MADVFLKPSEKQVEETRELLGDSFLWFCMKGIIKDLSDKKFSSNEVLWFSLTRRMFQNYPAMRVYGLIEKALEEASDEQWLNKKYPNFVFKETFRKIEGISVRDIVNKHLKISEVAQHYGIVIKNKMAKCPFHGDTKPSLIFNDTRNTFKCFGCEAHGGIIEFIQKIEGNNGKKGS